MEHPTGGGARDDGRPGQVAVATTTTRPHTTPTQATEANSGADSGGGGMATPQTHPSRAGRERDGGDPTMEGQIRPGGAWIRRGGSRIRPRRPLARHGWPVTVKVQGRGKERGGRERHDPDRLRPRRGPPPPPGRPAGSGGRRRPRLGRSWWRGEIAPGSPGRATPGGGGDAIENPDSLIS